MTPRRIAVACFPTLGGSGIVATEIGCRLAARGHEVRFFAAEPPARLEAGAPRVSFQRVSAGAVPPLDAATYPLALASALADAVVRDGFDVIHAHYAIPHAASAVLAAAMVRRAGHRAPRVVSTFHGTDITVHGADPTLRSVVRHLAAESDALSVPSAWLRDRAIENLALGDQPVAVIRNFIDARVFRPHAGDLRELFPHLPGWDDAPRRPRVLFHGSSFRPLKRVGDTVRALAELSRIRQVALVLVGDGPERARVEQLAETLGVADRVHFLGLLPRFSDLLGRADLFLLPSETESFGLAALEALAAGVPVIASAVGGLPEVVRHGETGLLVPPADPSALAAACLSLLEDEPRRRKMAEAARADAVHRFDPEPTLDQYEHLLNSPHVTRQGTVHVA